MGVRVPPEVIKIFLTKIFLRLSLFGHVAISRKKFLWAYYVLNIYCLHLYRSLMRIYFALLLYTILYWEGRLKVLWPWNDIDTAVFCMIFQLCWPFLLTSNKILLRLLIQSPCVWEVKSCSPIILWSKVDGVADNFKKEEFWRDKYALDVSERLVVHWSWHILNELFRKWLS